MLSIVGRAIFVAVPIIMTAFVAGSFGAIMMTALRDEWSTMGMVVATCLTIGIGLAILAACGKVVVTAPKLLPALTYWGDGKAIPPGPLSKSPHAEYLSR